MDQDQALRVLRADDLALLRQRATWAIARAESGKQTRLTHWNRAVLAVIDDEEQRRRGLSGTIRDADHCLRSAAASLTEREIFLLSMDYQITIDDVEVHWGRSYIPFLTTLRNTLHHQLSRQR